MERDQVRKKLSRRGLLALAGASAALGPLAAQVPAPANLDPVEKARQDNRRSAENLNKFQIPMSTEPAFVFRP
jgi:hypothetical protein